MEVVIPSRALHIPIHWEERCVCGRGVGGQVVQQGKRKGVVPAVIKPSGKPASDTDLASSCTMFQAIRKASSRLQWDG